MVVMGGSGFIAVGTPGNGCIQKCSQCKCTTVWVNPCIVLAPCHVGTCTVPLLGVSVVGVLGVSVVGAQHDANISAPTCVFLPDIPSLPKDLTFSIWEQDFEKKVHPHPHPPLFQCIAHPCLL